MKLFWVMMSGVNTEVFIYFGGHVAFLISVQMPSVVLRTWERQSEAWQTVDCAVYLRHISFLRDKLMGLSKRSKN